jgi:hypothetical protein
VLLKKLTGRALPAWFRNTDPGMSSVREAMQCQGKIWESLLIGQARGKDYIVAASYADAADHLVGTWSSSLGSLARSLNRTLIGRIAIWGTLFLGTAFIALFVFGAVHSGTLSGGGKAFAAAGGAIAAALAAFNIHVTRTQVSSAIAKVWDTAEPSVIESEVYEAIAAATRRIPATGIGGGTR